MMISPIQAATAHVSAATESPRASQHAVADRIDSIRPTKDAAPAIGPRGALQPPSWSLSPHTAERVDCVFLWRDTGDAQNLLPVAEALVSAGKTVRVIALGHAARNVAEGASALRGQVLSLDAIRGVASKLGDKAEDLGGGAGHRTRFLEHEDAARIAGLFDTPIVITGCVSKAQRNVCAAFKSKANPPRIVGYVDSLAINPSSMLYHHSTKTSQFEQAHGDTSTRRVKRDPYSVSAFEAVVDTLWVPFAGSVSDIATRAGFAEARVEAVGHPATERVLKQLAERQARGERAEIRRQLMGDASDRPLVFYAGGRRTDASNTYGRSFQAFVAGVLDRTSKHPERPIKVVVGLHPASDGVDETQVIGDLGAEHLVTVDTAHAWATDDMLLASDIVVAWNSTVASQAALLEGTLRKHVCFVDVADTPDLPLVVPAGLAQQARTSDAFAKFLVDAFAPQTSPQRATALSAHAAEKMAGMVIDAARETRGGASLSALTAKTVLQTHDTLVSKATKMVSTVVSDDLAPMTFVGVPMDAANVDVTAVRAALAKGLGVSTDTPFLQVIGDSGTTFSEAGMRVAQDILLQRMKVTPAIIEYGATASKGDTNWAVGEYLRVNQNTPAVGNLVRQSVEAITDWKCSVSPSLRTFVLAYRNDGKPTQFGDDTDASDNIMSGSKQDVLLCLEGGPQSLLQVLNVLHRDVPVLVRTGLRDAPVGKPRFSAAALLLVFKSAVKEGADPHRALLLYMSNCTATAKQRAVIEAWARRIIAEIEPGKFMRLLQET